MLDLLVMWGHSADDSISNPQVWTHSLQTGRTSPAAPRCSHFFPSDFLCTHQLLFLPPLSILASMSINLKAILSQLLSFSCLFKDDIPTQLENKAKPATGTQCCNYPWAAPALQKDGPQAPRVLLIPTVLPENKLGESLTLTSSHKPSYWGLYPPSQPPQTQKVCVFSIVILHHKGFLTPRCGSLNHHFCLSCLQGALQMLPSCAWRQRLLGTVWIASHSGGYRRWYFPKCSSSSQRP